MVLVISAENFFLTLNQGVYFIRNKRNKNKKKNKKKKLINCFDQLNFFS